MNSTLLHARQLRTAALVTALSIFSGLGPVHACGYHDPSGMAVGMLNLAYPDALHVRTAVWMAQREGIIDRVDPVVTTPQSPELLLLQMARLRDVQAQLDRLRTRAEGQAGKQPLPSFAVVLIGSMLWTRFDLSGDTLTMAVHANGPSQDDVVIVTDAPVVAALADDRLSFHAALGNGLLRFYGPPDRVERLSRVLDQRAPAQAKLLSSSTKPSEVH